MLCVKWMRRWIWSAAQALKECFKVVKRGGKIVSIAGTPEPTTAVKDIAQDSD